MSLLRTLVGALMGMDWVVESKYYNMKRLSNIAEMVFLIMWDRRGEQKANRQMKTPLLLEIVAFVLSVAALFIKGRIQRRIFRPPKKRRMT